MILNEFKADLIGNIDGNLLVAIQNVTINGKIKGEHIISFENINIIVIMHLLLIINHAWKMK